MASSKNKLDPTKLTLPGKKTIAKPDAFKQADTVETAVRQIHEAPGKGVGEDKPKEKEQTKRTTLDIPETLHKQIKRRLVDDGLTIKDYFLQLAKKDLGLQ